MQPAVAPHYDFPTPRSASSCVPSHRRSDVIYIGGADAYVQHAEAVREGCIKQGLNGKTQGPGDMPEGPLKGIRSLHAAATFHQRSLLKFDCHGTLINGELMLQFESDAVLVPALGAIQAVRQGGREFGYPDFEGMVVLHVCGAANLKAALRNVTGPHLLVGGKRAVLTCLGKKIDRILLEELGRQKKTRWQAPETLWGPLYFSTPCTLHLAGAGILQLVRHVRVPADLRLAANEEQIQDAFFQRLAVGKPEQVRQFLNVWPRLATAQFEGDSIFRNAEYAGPDMMITLLDEDNIPWEQDLEVLLQLSKRNWPVTTRAFNRILEVLEKKMQRVLSANPADRLKAGVGVAKVLLQNAFFPRLPEDTQDLSTTLTDTAPAFNPLDLNATAPDAKRICATLDWHLIDQVVRRASSVLDLSRMDRIEFRLELNVQMHADLKQRG